MAYSAHRRGKRSILIIDDEESIRFAFHRFLGGKGYDVSTAASYEEALEALNKSRFDIIFLDIVLGGDSGIALFRDIRERGNNSVVVIITGAPNLDSATEAVRLGAYDYLMKPVKLDSLQRITEKIFAEISLMKERERYRALLESVFTNIDYGIITVDSTMVITELNGAASRLCGFRREQIGMDVRGIDIHTECLERCIPALETALREGRDVELYRVECRRNNPLKTVTVRFTPITTADESFRGCMMIIHDETRISYLEESCSQRRRLHNIVGSSKRMQEVYSLIETLSGVDTTVLITGESGTGKELVAEAIHETGPRAGMPMIRINCSALPETLLESELFGHRRGAFTGAISDRKGRFEAADGGTLFLDEVGDLSPAIQVKLLRVLQEKEFERLGDTLPLKVDVRIIAATNRDLKKRVMAGQFREDLYYRLKVMEISIPPLRERKDDIPELVEFFLRKMGKKFQREYHGLSDEVMKLFLQYPWPGNVRELEHALEHACLVAEGGMITTDHLPPELRIYAPHRFDRGEESQDNGLMHGGSEREAIMRALERTAGNKARAARLLGISRRTLYRKMKGLKIPLGIDERLL